MSNCASGKDLLQAGLQAGQFHGGHRLAIGGRGGAAHRQIGQTLEIVLLQVAAEVADGRLAIGELRILGFFSRRAR